MPTQSCYFGRVPWPFFVEERQAGRRLRSTHGLYQRSIDSGGHRRLCGHGLHGQLAFDCADNVSFFLGDPTQIRQIVLNLITNASEALGDQTGSIKLTTGVKFCRRADLDDVHEDVRSALGEPPPEGRYASIEVADTGCGWTPPPSRKIFDPFFTTKFTGRGLGMSAVLGIVRAHGGAFNIRSEVGQGTTIRLLFPAAEPSGSDRAVGPLKQRVTVDWQGTGTFLMVDDDMEIRAIGKMMLEEFGFDVLTASDGLEAVQVFSVHKDQIVGALLDLTMPRMDGIEALAHLRRLRSDLPVIVASGYAERDVGALFVGEERTAFLQKPYSEAELADRLAEILGPTGAD